jgi:hypothetical protein
VVLNAGVFVSGTMARTRRALLSAGCASCIEPVAIHPSGSIPVTATTGLLNSRGLRLMWDGSSEDVREQEKRRAIASAGRSGESFISVDVFLSPYATARRAPVLELSFTQVLARL